MMEIGDKAQLTLRHGTSPVTLLNVDGSTHNLTLPRDGWHVLTTIPPSPFSCLSYQILLATTFWQS